MNVAVTLASVVLVWFGLRPRGEPAGTAAATVPVPEQAAGGRRG